MFLFLAVIGPTDLFFDLKLTNLLVLETMEAQNYEANSHSLPYTSFVVGGLGGVTVVFIVMFVLQTIRLKRQNKHSNKGKYNMWF